MKHAHRPLVVGNWKMNPRTLAEAVTLARAVAKVAKSHHAQVDVMVAPPFPFLGAVAKVLGSKTLPTVAQDMSPEPMGAFTGSVSAAMLRSVDASAVIVGHSERRKAGMSNEAVNAVVLAALKSNLLPIVCIGEVERDARGDFYGVVERQLTIALAGVPRSKLGQVVVAYEPVWAIGTGKNATPEDVEEMKLFVQKVLITLYGRAAAPKVRILYGGSVNSKNVEALAKDAAVDGFLVGGASLDVAEFSTIIKVTKSYVAA